MKLVGKLINEDNAMWCNVLKNKYNVTSMIKCNSIAVDSKH